VEERALTCSGAHTQEDKLTKSHPHTRARSCACGRTQDDFGTWHLFIPDNADGTSPIPHNSRYKIAMTTSTGEETVLSTSSAPSPPPFSPSLIPLLPYSLPLPLLHFLLPSFPQPLLPASLPLTA
jgi:hypothetical protein